MRTTTRTAIVLTVIAALAVAGTVSASTLTRPQILKQLTDLEVCLRTMCIPANDASMSIGGATDLLKKLAVNPNPMDRWVTQRVNAVVLDLKQKHLKDGLTHLQATIKELPATRAGSLNGKNLSGFVGSNYASLHVSGSSVSGIVGSNSVFWSYFGNTITGTLGSDFVNLTVNGKSVTGFAGSQFVSLNAF